MKTRALLAEALAAARSAVIPTVLVAMVVGATCLSVLLTVGRQAAAEQALAEQLSGPDARTMTVTVTATASRPTITPAAVEVISTLRGTSSVLATTIPRDTYNGALGPGATPLALVATAGTLDTAITLERGRLPAPGEAIVSAAGLKRLNLAEPIGWLEGSDGTQYPIVGQFTAPAPFDVLNDLAITAADPAREEILAGATYHQLRVVADSVEHVSAVENAALTILEPDPRQVQIQSASATAFTGQQATAALLGLGRALLLLILAAGGFFVTVVVLADVLIRRRDLGRRRTLGITQTDLVALVAIRTVAAASLGALAGTTAGLAALARDTSTTPIRFSFAVAILATATAILASLPPATYAATRDPVKVMRTP